MDTMNKENWISEIENVSDRIASTKVPADVLQRIKAIPFTVEKKLETLPMRTVWMVAASIAVLIAVNVFVFSRTNYSFASDDITETYFKHTQHL